MYESRWVVFWRGVFWWTIGLLAFKAVTGIGEWNLLFNFVLSLILNAVYITFARTLFEVGNDVVSRNDPTYNKLRNQGWSPGWHDPSLDMKQKGWYDKK